MGTEITLQVGPVTLDWSKNSRGGNHGILFQEKDRTQVPAPEYDNELLASDDGGVYALALVRPLSSTVPRLEILGFTLRAAQDEYDAVAAEWLSYQDDIAAAEGFERPRALSFAEFVQFLARHPINELDDNYINDFHAERYQTIQKRFSSDPAFGRIPTCTSLDGFSEAEIFGSILGGLHPYSAMRILASVPANSSVNICWHYGPVVDSGWVTEDEFAAGAQRQQKFLVVTEGSSDIHILSHAISLMMPEISDFFTFIDVSERHPFSGTGSLVKFAEGLVKIDVQNRVLFLFDNDAEGWAALDEVVKYVLPPNMRAMALPELEEFRKFDAYGPQGVAASDINKRAAAIECYLDLRLEGKPPARVVWTNYKEKRDVYQGSLEFKESYAKAFLAQTFASISSGTYDVSKLRLVLDRIVKECTEIAGIDARNSY